MARHIHLHWSATRGTCTLSRLPLQGTFQSHYAHPTHTLTSAHLCYHLALLPACSSADARRAARQCTQGSAQDHTHNPQAVSAESHDSNDMCSQMPYLAPAGCGSDRSMLAKGLMRARATVHVWAACRCTPAACGNTLLQAALRSAPSMLPSTPRLRAADLVET